MEDYYSTRKQQVPAFGSWDWNSDLPFTQCFKSPRHAGFLRYSYSGDRDLYVAGDLYDNHLFTPAVIVVPRRKAKVRETRGKEEKNWVKETAKTMARPTPKPVDEDLYKISPDLLYARTKKKRRLGFFSSCLIPTCVL